MREQTNTPARHQAILDEAAEHLQTDDTSAYWQSMSKISRKYATLAGQVADNKTIIGRGARERLQTFAEKHKGRRFTDAEMDQIEVEIAEADLAKRRENLKNEGNAGVTVQETDRYHTDVFEDKGIPPEAYTLHNAVKEMGPVADAWRDTEYPDDPKVAARIEKAEQANRGRLGERLGQKADVVADFASAGLGGLKASRRAAGELSDEVAGDKTGAAKRRAMRDNAGQFREVWDLGFPDNPNLGKPPAKVAAPKGSDSPDIEGSSGQDNLVGVSDKDQLAGKSKLVEDLSKVDDPVGDLLFKAAKDLTAEELKKVQYRAADEPDREKSNAFHDLAMGNFDHRYGTDPVQYDAVGRMIQPPELRPHPAQAKPATGKSGQPLDQAMKTVAKTLADEAGDEPPAETTRNLQAGLNMMAEKVMDAAAKKQPRHLAGSGKPKPAAPRPLFTALKVDGQPGPKTRSALKTTAAKLGEAKVREGAALGRFQRALQANPAPNEGQLRDKAERAFGTLFRPRPAPAATSKPAPKPRQRQGLVEDTRPKPEPNPYSPVGISTPEGIGLQTTVNDLGSKSLGSAFKPIKEDGIIGPKTTSAFNEVLPKVGPSAFTSAFGSHMGFFDDED